MRRNPEMGSLLYWKPDSIEQKIGEKNKQRARVRQRLVYKLKKLIRETKNPFYYNNERRIIDELMKNCEYLELISVQISNLERKTYKR